jgi:hypothetical protein
MNAMSKVATIMKSNLRLLVLTSMLLLVSGASLMYHFSSPTVESKHMVETAPDVVKYMPLEPVHIGNQVHIESIGSVTQYLFLFVFIACTFAAMFQLAHNLVTLVVLTKLPKPLRTEEQELEIRKS